MVIHEFLHTTGKFKMPDVRFNLDGTVDNSKSEKYTKEVLKKCFPKERS